MEILIIGSVLFGIVLARFFTVYVLVPACALTAVLVIASPIHAAHGSWAIIFEVVVSIASIQLGYIAGLLLQALPNSLQRFRVDSPYVTTTLSPSAGPGLLGHRRVRKVSRNKSASQSLDVRSSDRPKKNRAGGVTN